MSQKIPPHFFLTIFRKRLGIFSPNFTRLFYVPIYTGLQIFIQLSVTLTELRHISLFLKTVTEMCGALSSTGRLFQTRGP